MNNVEYRVDINIEKALQYIDEIVANGLNVDFNTASEKAFSLIECSIKHSGDYTGP